MGEPLRSPRHGTSMNRDLSTHSASFSPQSQTWSRPQQSRYTWALRAQLGAVPTRAGDKVPPGHGICSSQRMGPEVTNVPPENRRAADLGRRVCQIGRERHGHGLCDCERVDRGGDLGPLWRKTQLQGGTECYNTPCASPKSLMRAVWAREGDGGAIQIANETPTCTGPRAVRHAGWWAGDSAPRATALAGWLRPREP